MPDTLFELILLLIGTGGVGSLAGVGVSLWLGKRNVDNADARLGLDALVAGLKDAQATVDHLRQTLTDLETQAHKVLSENNRFRLLHGVQPATSLEGFDPLAKEDWDYIGDAIRKAYGVGK